MTDDKKIKNRELIKKHGLYPQSSVFEETIYLMSNLSALAAGRTIFTDEHKFYIRAYRSFNCLMDLQTISSKATRDSSNPLCPINRLHNLYRHFFSSQQRETISFQKHDASLMEKLKLMKIYRNFMDPKFEKYKYDPNAHKWSLASYIGVANKIMRFEEFFGVRKLKSHVKLDKKEVEFMKRCYQFSRQKIVA